MFMWSGVMSKAVLSPRRLSVIVPIYNEIATVEEALRALVAKRISGWEIELILVESNSSDGTREVVASYVGRP